MTFIEIGGKRVDPRKVEYIELDVLRHVSPRSICKENPLFTYWFNYSVHEKNDIGFYRCENDSYEKTINDLIFLLKATNRYESVKMQLHDNLQRCYSSWLCMNEYYTHKVNHVSTCFNL